MSEVAARFFDRAGRHPDVAAIVDARGCLPYAGAAARVRALAGALRRASVGAGDIVAIAGEAHRDVLLAALAARTVGAVAMLRARGGPPPPAHVLFEFADRDEPSIVRLPEPAVPSLPASTAWLRATGGTTGEPRWVAVSDGQLAAGAAVRSELLGLAPGHTVVTTLPPTTGYGSMTGGFGLLLGGATLRPVSPLSPRAVLAAARTGAAWTLSTAPVVRALARLAADEGRPTAEDGAGSRADEGAATEGAPTPARMLVSAAAYPAAEADLVRRRHGLVVLDRYGTTETGPIAQAREPGGPLHPVPGVEVRLLGDPAIVEVRGPSVALGYLGGPPFHGVFRTSDRARLAPGGGFVVDGRADRIVRRAGRPVDLEQLERILVSQDGVARARVRAVPGALDLDLVAAVVLEGDATADGAALLVALASRLAPWERPIRVDVVAAAAADAAGKWRLRDADP